MEIVRERLEREYDLDLLATTPNVRYMVHLTNGEEVEVHSPTGLPDPGTIEAIEEPYIRATIICPSEQVGAVMELCQGRRGTHVDMSYLSPQRVQIRYDMPLAEIVLDFFDLLKSSTRGYASLDYEPIGNRPSDLAKVDILLAGDKVDALSIIVHRDFAYDQGKRLVERLRKTIPRQQFDVPVQAAIGSNILARETVKAVRKDVTAKLYGGDVTRKQKLLKKQKAGKKRMKSVGRVEVPQEAFLAVLQIDDEIGFRPWLSRRMRLARNGPPRPTRWARRRSASTRASSVSTTRSTRTGRRRRRPATATSWRRRCSPSSTAVPLSARRSSTLRSS
jgi:GTP-binding protein LepA